MTPQPRALLVAHQYWPTPGSATAVLTALVRELRAGGCDVDVATCMPPEGIEAVAVGPNGERVHFVAPSESGRHGFDRVRSLAEFAAGVRRLGRKLDFDVVISDPPPTAGIAALRLATRKGTPFVYYMADSWTGASKGASGLAGLGHPLIKRLEYRVLRKATRVLAATAGMAEIARNARARDIEIVENGVPLDTFSPDGAGWNPTGNERPFLLYAGNAGVVHGAHVFAEGARELWDSGRDFDLVYMGYGQGLPEVEAVAAQYTDRVHLVSSQPLDRVAAAFRASAAALCSLRPNDLYADARPIKAMTGLACGAPSVFVGSGAFASVIESEQLGFVRPWSPQGATEAMALALDQLAEESAYTALRQKCAAYADEHLGDRAAARRAADAVLTTIGTR